LLEAQRLMDSVGILPDTIAMVGGGTRSRFWMQIIANVLGRRLVRYRGSGIGPAFGAARLARMAVTGEGPEEVCVKPDVLDILTPDPAVTEAYAERFVTYSALYRSLRPEFHRQANALQ
jgi:xylulokinase